MLRQFISDLARFKTQSSNSSRSTAWSILAWQVPQVRFWGFRGCQATLWVRKYFSEATMKLLRDGSLVHRVMGEIVFE